MHFKWFRRTKKGFEFMVQLTVSFNVVSAAPALVVTPASISENLTVGVAVPTGTIAVVSGGVPPYSYNLDQASQALPAGVSFVEDGAGNISLLGTPTAAGTANVVLDITDSSGQAVQLKVSK
jgi:hypothetical protein